PQIRHGGQVQGRRRPQDDGGADFPLPVGIRPSVSHRIGGRITGVVRHRSPSSSCPVPSPWVEPASAAAVTAAGLDAADRDERGDTPYASASGLYQMASRMKAKVFFRVSRGSIPPRWAANPAPTLEPMRRKIQRRTSTLPRCMWEMAPMRDMGS